eukprot:scaffold6828_cov116-Isochrysis_galbana.AAC.1
MGEASSTLRRPPVRRRHERRPGAQPTLTGHDVASARRARWSLTDPPAAPAMILDRSPGHRAHTCSPARPERTPPRRQLRASAAPITIEQR